MSTDTALWSAPATTVLTIEEHIVTTLRVAGLVSRPGLFQVTDLAALPRASFTETFSCDQEWQAKSQTWTGPRLLDVLALAGLLPAGQYVRVGAGDYVVPVLLTDAAGALLADTLNGETLTAAHGAPWRLALPGKQCFTSVKWVDQLEVTAERGDNVGARLTSMRLRAERTAAGK